MANRLYNNKLLRGIEGAMIGLSKSRENQAKLRATEGEFMLNKQNTESLIKKRKADMEYQKTTGQISMAELELQKKAFSLQEKQFKAKSEYEALAQAAAKSKLKSEERDQRIRIQQLRDAYVKNTMAIKDKIKRPLYDLGDVQSMAEDRYSDLEDSFDTTPGSMVQESGAGNLLQSLDEEFKIK